MRAIVEQVLAEQGAGLAWWPDAGTGVSPGSFTVALGADHGGFELKGILLNELGGHGYRTVDCGSFSPEPVDYPDIAYAVARLVGQGEAWRGILIDGAGIGSAMAANKVPGVRAANCNTVQLASNAREHNDANVLTLGAKVVDRSTALEVVRIFLTTACTEPRHQKRVAKIMEIEKRYLRN